MTSKAELQPGFLFWRGLVAAPDDFVPAESVEFSSAEGTISAGFRTYLLQPHRRRQK